MSRGRRITVYLPDDVSEIIAKHDNISAYIVDAVRQYALGTNSCIECKGRLTRTYWQMHHGLICDPCHKAWQHHRPPQSSIKTSAPSCLADLLDKP